MVSVPLSVPVAVGEKVTLIVQEPPPETLPTQLSVSPKPVVAATLVMVSALVPVLVMVTCCGPLVVPTNCPANVTVDAERLPLAGEPNLLMKASAWPVIEVCKAPAVIGKLEERVDPATYAPPEASTATLKAMSPLAPPR
jgi:hypothetical protein